MIFDGILKTVRGIVKLRGGTDNTVVGNTGDRIKTDTFGGNSPFASFIVLGESVAIGNNKSMLSLLNATGSTVVVRIRDVNVTNTQTTGVTGVVSEFAFYRFTGHSGGTALTPAAMDTADTINGSVTARTGATITGETTKLYKFKWSSDEWGVGTSDVESSDHALSTLISTYRSDAMNSLKAITLRANEGLHIKHVVNSTAGTFDVFLSFTQESV